VFLLGDNRTRGPDSRYFGPVKASAVILRPLFVIWSWDRGRERVRWERIGLRI
jgi:type IV secretory pathway protease TraF